MTVPLFRLPLELRQQIYSHLVPPEAVSHPVSRVGITSVSHEPPSSDLLCVHPQLTEELRDYFFTVASWKVVFSHAFNFFRVDPTLSNLAIWADLGKIQRAEVVFFCDVLLLKEYPSFGLESFCAEIKRRAVRACQVLEHAHNLRHVTVSWIDTTDTFAWAEKAKVVEPLRALKDRVTFSIGEIIGPEDEDVAVFLDAINVQLDARPDCHTSTRRSPHGVRTELRLGTPSMFGRDSTAPT